jgi:hypothetical protein
MKLPLAGETPLSQKRYHFTSKYRILLSSVYFTTGLSEIYRFHVFVHIKFDKETMGYKRVLCLFVLL